MKEDSAFMCTYNTHTHPSRPHPHAHPASCPYQLYRVKRGLDMVTVEPSLESPSEGSGGSSGLEPLARIPQ